MEGKLVCACVRERTREQGGVCGAGGERQREEERAREREKDGKWTLPLTKSQVGWGKRFQESDLERSDGVVAVGPPPPTGQSPPRPFLVRNSMNKNWILSVTKTRRRDNYFHAGCGT